MNSLHSIEWRPIADLPSDWASSLDLPEVHAQVNAWKAKADELRQKEQFEHFLERLHRQWAIETGVIEGVYYVNDPGTKTLIDHGFDAALLGHGETDQPPADVIAKIKDQYNALQLLYDFIGGDRPFGTWYVKELHQLLTAHQPTYVARNTLGNTVTRELPRGEWKLWPNDVDGTVLRFCPPEHVASEMDRLVELYAAHKELGVPPDVEAAWLHHRFTLIHPFTDGNGRVARCLATLVLLREHWFPFVVTRSDRDNYIATIRQADLGDLRPLVAFIGTLQRRAIREALSLAEAAMSGKAEVRRVLESVKEKLETRRLEKQRQAEHASQLAESLRELAQQRLQDVADEVLEFLTPEGPSFNAYADGARWKTDRDFWFKRQIVQCAGEKYFANTDRYRSWARLTIETDQRTELLLAFHGIGRGDTGVLGCAAMSYTRFPSAENGTEVGDVTGLTYEPFEFAETEDPTSVQKRFSTWLENAVAAGLDYWRRSL